MYERKCMKMNENIRIIRMPNRRPLRRDGVDKHGFGIARASPPPGRRQGATPRCDAKVRRQGATHAATRYDEYDGLCSDSNAASCRAGACVYLHSNAAEREKILMKILMLLRERSVSIFILMLLRERRF